MDSLETPVNMERKLKLERERIISDFRNKHLGSGTTNGTLKALLTMFSNDPARMDTINETYEDGSVFEGTVNVDNVRTGKGRLGVKRHHVLR